MKKFGFLKSKIKDKTKHTFYLNEKTGSDIQYFIGRCLLT